jgi:hypothetical protein
VVESQPHDCFWTAVAEINQPCLLSTTATSSLILLLNFADEN